MTSTEAVNRVDAAQRRHRWLGVAVATGKKFQEDRSQYLAGLLAFWAFFSIFPLLLLLVSVLGYVLPGSTKSNVLHHVAALFPMIDPKTVGHLSGSAWTIIVGGITALWSGTAVMRSTEHAFNSVWEIPMTERPKMGEQLWRALKALSTIGVGLVISTLLSGFVTGKNSGVHLGTGGMIGGYVLDAALDIGVFLVAFRMLTDRDISFKTVLPGALLSGIAFWILEQLSSFIISRHLSNAQSTYGHFATVITILWWFYIQALVTMLGAQLNVVLAHGLHPRRVGDSERTDADRRTLKAYADSRVYENEEQVDLRLKDGEEPAQQEGARPKRQG